MISFCHFSVRTLLYWGRLQSHKLLQPLAEIVLSEWSLVSIGLVAHIHWVYRTFASDHERCIAGCWLQSLNLLCIEEWQTLLILLLRGWVERFVLKLFQLNCIFARPIVLPSLRIRSCKILLLIGLGILLILRLWLVVDPATVWVLEFCVAVWLIADRVVASATSLNSAIIIMTRLSLIYRHRFMNQLLLQFVEHGWAL